VRQVSTFDFKLGIAKEKVAFRVRRRCSRLGLPLWPSDRLVFVQRARADKVNAFSAALAGVLSHSAAEEDMNDEAAFLAAIQAAPEDDHLRLVYADWLEERGDLRGTYLRLEHQLLQAPLRLAQLREQIDPAWIAQMEREAVQLYWYSNRVTQRIAEGKVVPGVYFPAFIHNGDYYLASIVAYKDRMVDCWGLTTFEDFKEKVRDGWVVTSIPDGARVDIHHVARFTVSGISVSGPEEEFVKDVANAIEELNGRPTAQARLVKAIGGLHQQESPDLQREFRRAYADLPAYCRTYIFGSRMERYTDLQRLLDGEE
jgi:uncharacterized protein (TIGR02996 family)